MPFQPYLSIFFPHLHNFAGGCSPPVKLHRLRITTCAIALAEGGPHYASRPVQALPPFTKSFQNAQGRKGRE